MRLWLRLQSGEFVWRHRLMSYGTSVPVFYEIGGFVTTIPSRSFTPLLLKKSTTFGPSSGLPASMRYSSPPACTSTPSPCPTSIKLTESEPEGGGAVLPRDPLPGTRPQAGERRIRASRSGARRLAASLVKRDGRSAMPCAAAIPCFSNFQEVALAAGQD